MAALSNTKHEVFAQKTVELDNQSEAYRIAYPNSKRWKADTVWQHGSRLANDNKVKARIQEIREDLAKQMTITKQQMLNTLKTISEVSITDYYRANELKEGGFEMIPVTEWTKEMGMACTKVKPLGGGGFELTIHGTEYPYKELNKMLGHYAAKELNINSDSIANLLGNIDLDDE